MKKTDKIIGLMVAIVGIIAIVGYLIYNSLVIEVEVITLSEQSVERIIACAGTVSAKENEIVTYDETVIPTEINISVGDKVNDGDIIMTAYNSRMQKIKLYAECNGVVAAITATVGKEAKYGTALAVIAKTDEMQVTVQVSENEISAVKIGQKADVTGEGFSQKKYSGTVTHISSVAEQSSSNGAYVSVTVDINGVDENVLIGMTAKVYIIAKKVENAVAVPYSAIEYDGEKAYIYVADGNKISKVNVEIGTEGHEVAEITGGIKAGDKIVKDKSKVKNNFRVRVKENL